MKTLKTLTLESLDVRPSTSPAPSKKCDSSGQLSSRLVVAKLESVEMASNNKKSVNPLFTGGGGQASFSLQQSFGGPAILPVQPAPPPPTGITLPPPPPPAQTPPGAAAAAGPPPLGPPPSGLFLLPSTTTAPPQGTTSINSSRKTR